MTIMKTGTALLVGVCAAVGLATQCLAHEDEAGNKKTGTHLGTVHGVISDSMCKFDHEAMVKSGQYGKTDADCITKCEQQGMKLVLADKKNKTIYNFVNAKEAKPFAGKSVAITGHIDESSKVIHIHSIKAEK